MTETIKPSTDDDAVVARTPLDQLAMQLSDLSTVVAEAIFRHSAEHRSEKSWAWFRRIVFLIAAIGGVILYVGIYGGLFGLNPEPTGRSVGVVHIEGSIVRGELANADRVGGLIRSACRNDSVQGVVLRITSPGGSPSEAERIVQAVEACRPKDGPRKTVIAVIDGTGASAAYLVALSADKIYANRYAMVGSIGAIMTRFDAHDAIERFGVRQAQYASGHLKGMLSTWQKETPEQRDAAQDLVDQVGLIFRAEVEARRGDKLVKDTPDLYSGRAWLASEAKAIGLIDEVGVFEDAIEREFEGLRLHDYAPKRTIQDRLQIEQLVEAVADRVVSTMNAEPQWQ